MTLGRQLIAAAAQLLSVVIIARELGPEGNGYYAMAILVPTMLTNFLNLGVGPATVYFISRGDLSVQQTVSGNSKLALLLATSGLFLGFIALWFWGHKLFPDIPLKLLYLGLISFPFALFLAYLNSILQGLEDFKAFNLTVLVPPFINLTVVLIALYVLSQGVVGAMIAYIIGQLAGVVIVLRLLKKKKLRAAKKEKIKSISSYAKTVIGYGWKAHLSNILAFVNYRADIFLVNFFLNPAAAGIYVVAVQISEKIWMLSQAASTVLLPRLSSMHKDPKGRLALTNKSFFIVSAITLIGALLVAFVLWWLIGPIFGAEYERALPAFLWLLPGIIAGGGSRVLSNCIAAAGKPEWNMYSATVVVSLNIIGNILFVPKYGIVGAAWATSIAYCFNAVIKAVLVRKTLKIN